MEEVPLSPSPARLAHVLDLPAPLALPLPMPSVNLRRLKSTVVRTASTLRSTARLHPPRLHPPMRWSPRRRGSMCVLWCASLCVCAEMCSECESGVDRPRPTRDATITVLKIVAPERICVLLLRPRELVEREFVLACATNGKRRRELSPLLVSAPHPCFDFLTAPYMYDKLTVKALAQNSQILLLACCSTSLTSADASAKTRRVPFANSKCPTTHPWSSRMGFSLRPTRL